MKNEIDEKVIGLMKDESDGLREKFYSYLIDDASENKKAKDTKKGFIKNDLQQ